MSVDEIFGRVQRNVETPDGASINYVDEGEGEVERYLDECEGR